MKIKKGQNRKVSTGNSNFPKQEVKRYLGVLQEHTNDRFKAITEYFPDIHRKLDRHSDILLQHGQILETHTHMIGKIMEDIETIKENVDIVRSDLKRKVYQDEFSALTRLVPVLERHVLK